MQNQNSSHKGISQATTQTNLPGTTIATTATTSSTSISDQVENTYCAGLQIPRVTKLREDGKTIHLTPAHSQADLRVTERILTPIPGGPPPYDSSDSEYSDASEYSSASRDKNGFPVGRKAKLCVKRQKSKGPGVPQMLVTLHSSSTACTSYTTAEAYKVTIQQQQVAQITTATTTNGISANGTKLYGGVDQNGQQASTNADAQNRKVTFK